MQEKTACYNKSIIKFGIIFGILLESLFTDKLPYGENIVWQKWSMDEENSGQKKIFPTKFLTTINYLTLTCTLSIQYLHLLHLIYFF